MALHRLSNLDVLGFVTLIILVFESHRTFGSSTRGPFVFFTDDNGVNTAVPSGSDLLCFWRQWPHQNDIVHQIKQWILNVFLQFGIFLVTTDDGYILSVQRIPEGRVGGGGQNRQAVLLQRGVLVDGVTWLLNSPEQSLAMILADSGFDVWIANTRGTRFSRRHVSLNPNNPIVVYKTTGIGYGMILWSRTCPLSFQTNWTEDSLRGTFIGNIDSFGVILRRKTNRQDKISSFAQSNCLLEPYDHCTFIFCGIHSIKLDDTNFAYQCQQITTIFGLAEFNPTGQPVSSFVKALCAYPGLDCYDFMTALTGKNCCLNASTVDLFLKNEPQPTSTKNLVHLAQTVRDGILKKYDYGSSNYNLAHYGEAKPPQYNLANIPRDLPLFISYGGQDALSDSKDVETLLDYLKLHDVDKLHVQYVKDYAHADFIIGITAKDIVFNQIVNFFRNQH